MQVVSVVLLVFAVAFCVAIQSPPKEFRKQLAGPPTEFAFYQQPKPEDAALRSTSAWIPAKLRKTLDGWVWTDSIPVDSVREVSLSIFCTKYKDLQISVKPPGADLTLLVDSMFNTADAKGKKVINEFGIGETKMEVLTYIWPEPVTGFWGIEIKTTVDIPHPSDEAEIYLLIGNESPLEIATHLNTYDLQLGQEVGLVARVFDNSLEVENPMAQLEALQGVVISAEMDIVLPDGKQVLVPMNDAGINGDLQKNDGIYAAVLEATEVGTYVATCTIKGKTADGLEFIRNTLESFTVISPDFVLTGLASAEFTADKDVLQFYIDVDSLTTVTEGKVKAYAEVWGTDSTGFEYVPVAWIQAMVDVEQKGPRTVVAMELNKKWIQLAKASAPFQLRNVEIQEPDTNNPYSERREVFVQMEQSEVAELMSTIDFSVKPEITEEMLKGPRPATLGKAAGDHKLLLVHGYCAGANEFPPSQFTDPYIFEDFKKSKSNDQFALTIKGKSDQFSSFSIVGHSQAGLASLHLLSYYWSGMDVANGGRIVQSVGSPYQGTSIAGFLADMGRIFGLGCGSNYDLSRSGAANWLAKIPMNARKDIFYYTTQYEDYWWLLSNNCVTAGNVVLNKPNDGTTERKYGQLPGGNEVGHKKAWCHTNGMKYPAQCKDAERNKEMNEKAARA